MIERWRMDDDDGKEGLTDHCKNFNGDQSIESTLAI